MRGLLCLEETIRFAIVFWILFELLGFNLASLFAVYSTLCGDDVFNCGIEGLRGDRYSNLNWALNPALYIHQHCLYKRSSLWFCSVSGV